MTAESELGDEKLVTEINFHVKIPLLTAQCYNLGILLFKMIFTQKSDKNFHTRFFLRTI